MTLNILYIIAARRGSKRLPGKNIRVLGGHPLIGYKAVSAKAAESCARLIVSTDDEAKRKLVLVGFLILVGGALEAFSVGLIFPLIQLIDDPVKRA